MRTPVPAVTALKRPLKVPRSCARDAVPKPRVDVGFAEDCFLVVLMGGRPPRQARRRDLLACATLPRGIRLLS